jgi:hypothetical protein
MPTQKNKNQQIKANYVSCFNEETPAKANFKANFWAQSQLFRAARRVRLLGGGARQC